MKEPEFTDAKLVIAEILAAGKSIYYISKLMRRQHIQIQRMQKSGRCQPYEFKMLEMIRDDLQLVRKPDNQPSGEGGNYEGKDSAASNAVGLDKSVPRVG